MKHDARDKPADPNREGKPDRWAYNKLRICEFYGQLQPTNRRDAREPFVPVSQVPLFFWWLLPSLAQTP